MDDRVGVELGDEVGDVSAVGQVGDAHVDGRALALGEALVDAHDLVAVARESVADPAARPAKTPGDDDA